MILYLVFDKKNHTCTSPAFGHDLSEAQEALRLINPENIDDLVIHVITEIKSIYDFFLLTVDENKSLPDFILNRSALAGEANEATPQPEGVSESLDLIYE